MTLTELLSSKGKTLAVAESLTGGLLADRAVSLPGASRVFLGGIVAYTDSIKASVLGVSAATLKAETAVSEAVAREMAEGVRRLFSSSVGISTTGYAGPAASLDEEVGRVFVAIATEQSTEVYPLSLTGTREEIRRKTVDFAVKTLKEELTKF